MKKTYILTVTGAQRVCLSRPGEEPFWTLDFSGMLTSVKATKSAVAFLRERGEQMVGGLELIEPVGSEMVWKYRITTEPIEQPAAV